MQWITGGKLKKQQSESQRWKRQWNISWGRTGKRGKILSKSWEPLQEYGCLNRRTVMALPLLSGEHPFCSPSKKGKEQGDGCHSFLFMSRKGSLRLQSHYTFKDTGSRHHYDNNSILTQTSQRFKKAAMCMGLNYKVQTGLYTRAVIQIFLFLLTYTYCGFEKVVCQPVSETNITQEHIEKIVVFVCEHFDDLNIIFSMADVV